MHLKNCLRNPANLQAALGYYRTLFNPATFGTPADVQAQLESWGRPLVQPTLYLHGTRDGCIALSDDTLRQVPQFLGPGSEAHWVEGVGHFMLVQNPAEVNARILKFIGAPT